MKRAFTILLLLACSTSAAITERYVTSAGAGSADGTSEANAMSYATFKDYMETGGSFTAAAGDRFNLKGSFSIGATLTAVNGGSSTSPVIIRGYGTTPGDGYLGRTNGNGALITTNMPALTFSSGFGLNATGTWIVLESLNVSGTFNSALVQIAGNSAIVACKAANASTGASGMGLYGSSANACVFNSDASTGAGGLGAIVLVGNGASAIGNRTTGGAMGIRMYSLYQVAINNTIYTQATDGIGFNSANLGGLLLNNTIVGCTGDGIDMPNSTTVQTVLVGNMLTDNGGYGINLNNAACAAFLAYNRTRDNTSGPINLGTDWVSATNYNHVTTDTGGASTDYTASGSNDYSLIAASPATSAGIPAYSSIGALQRNQTSSGGGAFSFTWAQ